ncbi:MAG: DUF4236 domain-containing protein [Chloroflexota bacterium]
MTQARGVRKCIEPGCDVRLNLGTMSTGISFGAKGLRDLINSSGRKTRANSIPGPGISSMSTSRFPIGSVGHMRLGSSQ